MNSILMSAKRRYLVFGSFLNPYFLLAKERVNEQSDVRVSKQQSNITTNALVSIRRQILNRPKSQKAFIRPTIHRVSNIIF